MNVPARTDSRLIVTEGASVAPSVEQDMSRNAESDKVDARD